MLAQPIQWEMYTNTGIHYNIKMPSYQYKKSPCGDKTTIRLSYLHKGIFYTFGKIAPFFIKSSPCISYKNPHDGPETLSIIPTTLSIINIHDENVVHSDAEWSNSSALICLKTILSPSDRLLHFFIKQKTVKYSASHQITALNCFTSWKKCSIHILQFKVIEYKLVYFFFPQIPIFCASLINQYIQDPGLVITVPANVLAPLFWLSAGTDWLKS